MRLSVFSSKTYDKVFLERAHLARNGQASSIHLTFHDYPLNPSTADLVRVRGVLLRCAGFNNVDLEAAERLGLSVANVPSYSPEAVAEYTVALIQTLNRKTHRAYNRVREGIIGTGKIGIAFARIMKGFGCKLYAFDPFPNPAFEEYGEYLELDDLLARSDLVSLHCPLMEQTHHIINQRTLALMKEDAMLVNTSRGGLIDTSAVIAALKSQKLGGLALDVYEGEGKLFYNDHSHEILDDDGLARLLTFHNVVVSGHQAFFTVEALEEIAECTLRNLEDLSLGVPCANSLIKKGVHTRLRGKSLPVRNV
ncbi:unnamed protein product [Parascedosporium putredinis]|uniref:D-lactate dehydrogenase n=1 Tax=Parascedosporium putredinis TaxID=1442378 RepID=A0A9P1MC09_9PEZI|nr:unnamed protein product [Parascedosporium putredinis]CAI7997491.1 unnamed protein product [Parascedosporium putredinis]